MAEDWATIEDFPDYAVNEYGEIVNIKTHTIRKLSINQYGIVKVSIYRGKELHTRSVALLVAQEFVDGQTAIFDTPIHLDGDKRNCRADNLMWRPRWYAVRYHQQFYEEAFHNSEEHIRELTTRQEFDSVKEACMEFGLWYGDIYRSFLREERFELTGHEFRLVE